MTPLRSWEQASLNRIKRKRAMKDLGAFLIAFVVMLIGLYLVTEVI